MNNNLVQLFGKMADLTKPKCAECKLHYSCCSSEYCEIAIDLAENDGVTLTPTNHPKLKMMGISGCIASPHYRPLCTLHICSINSLGYDKDEKFNEEYFNLREKIETEYLKEIN